MAKYNIDKILGHAIDIEETGQKFYAMLAERLEDSKLKKIFSLMSQQEVGHSEIYKRMREQLPAAQADTDTQADQFDFKKHEMLEDKIFNRLDIVQKTPKLTRWAMRWL